MQSHAHTCWWEECKSWMAAVLRQTRRKVRGTSIQYIISHTSYRHHAVEYRSPHAQISSVSGLTPIARAEGLADLTACLMFVRLFDGWLERIRSPVSGQWWYYNRVYDYIMLIMLLLFHLPFSRRFYDHLAMHRTVAFDTGSIRPHLVPSITQSTHNEHPHNHFAMYRTLLHSICSVVFDSGPIRPYHHRPSSDRLC